MTMGQQFRIEIDGWMAGGSGLSEVQDTTAEIVMSVDSRLITEVEDRHAKTVRKSIRASAYLLASWLVSNWWRLRWEPYSKRQDRMVWASIEGFLILCLQPPVDMHGLQ